MNEINTTAPKCNIDTDHQPNHLAITDSISQYERRLDEFDDLLNKIRGENVSEDETKAQVIQEPSLEEVLKGASARIHDLNVRFSNQLDALRERLF